jgi:hypothetical protein
MVFKTYEKNIVHLEGLWDGGTDEWISVAPLIEFIAKLNEVKFTHLTCNTRREFEFGLGDVCNSRRKKDHAILYLAFHGLPGRILFPDGDSLSLEELADLIGDKFQDWIVHFGSCSTLSTKVSQVRDFFRSTKVALLVGYRKKVDWTESTSMDLILLDWMENYKSMGALKKKVESSYQDLIFATGLCIYHPKGR